MKPKSNSGQASEFIEASMLHDSRSLTWMSCSDLDRRPQVNRIRSSKSYNVNSMGVILSCTLQYMFHTHFPKYSNSYYRAVCI